MPIRNRPAHSFLRALELATGFALVVSIAIGFLAAGGRGRVVELLAIGCAVVVGYAAGAAGAMLVAVLAAGSVLALEAAHGRLGSTHAAAGAAYALATAVAVIISGRLRPERDPWRSDARPQPGTLEYEVRHALRHGRSFSLLVVHADERGQDLAALAQPISDTIRATDYAAGRDGRDIWLLLPETTCETARIAAERIRLAAGAAARPVSIGIASCPQDGNSSERLAESARRALLRALELGGNRTVLHTVPDDRPPGWGLASVGGTAGSPQEPPSH